MYKKINFHDGLFIDIDECKEDNGGCEHECVNIDGGYYCKCPLGYSLSSNDNHTCPGMDHVHHVKAWNQNE